MPMLHITADPHSGPRLHADAGAWDVALRDRLERDAGPVTVMVHGYKYHPGHPVHCPHMSILSRGPQLAGPKVISWPRHLGLRGQPGEGLGLSFGWSARGSIWEAFDRAGGAGDHLATVLDRIRQIDPDRQIRAIGHSMGARVILRAMRQSAPGTLSRVVLLAAAEFQETTRTSLQSPGGRDCGVLNVTSRENDLFDFLIERLIAPPRHGDRVLGFGADPLPNLATLQIDDDASLRALRRAGFVIAPPARRICHWSSYRRPGVFRLYHAFSDQRIGLRHLRALLPDDTAPRWSRLMPPLPSLPGPGPRLAG